MCLLYPRERGLKDSVPYIGPSGRCANIRAIDVAFRCERAPHVRFLHNIPAAVSTHSCYRQLRGEQLL